MTKNKKRVKIFQIVQHNSYINSRQVIAKKSVNSTGKAQLPSTGLAHFSRDQSFNKKITLALGIECEAQVNLIIVQLKYLHYMVLFHIPRPTSNVESQATDK